jgi:hypothetical protein
MKAPKAPSAGDTARAQSQADLSSAMAQTLLNQTNQTTPYGSLEYSQRGEATYYDPLLKTDVTIPQFLATQKLSPEQQKLLEQEQVFDRRSNEIALGQVERVGNVLGTPFKYNPGEHEKWAGKTYDALNLEANQRDQGLLDQKLKNQGLAPGSEAYNDAMQNIQKSQAADRTSFMLDSYGTGINTALTERNQPIKEVTSLMSGGQISQPNFVTTPTTNWDSVDMAGLMQNNYNQQVAQRNALIGGVSGMLGTAASGWAMSDARVKEGIRKIGEMIDGTNVYQFRYKPGFGNGHIAQLGVMAQEILETHPDAVAEVGDSGLLAVNYDTLNSEVASEATF